MKNYYEILEINEKASQEIIEKVYKVLVKKYHPDLQETAEAKAKCEEKIKEINEAYDILSNSEKRAEYDAKLEQEKKEKEFKAQASTNTRPQNNYNNVQQTYTRPNTSTQPNYASDPIYETIQRQAQEQAENQYREQLNRERQYQQDYQNAINQAYHDAYIQDLKNRGYKIRYKKTKKDYLRSLIALLITIGILALIFQLPFVKNYFTDLYNNNSAFKGFIDFFGNMFK